MKNEKAPPPPLSPSSPLSSSSPHHPITPSPTPTWRLIPPMAATGTVQMAVDAWLLDQHCQGLQPPSLRFYTWSEPTISLGYHQRHWPDDWRRLSWQGHPLELVRRPSGGRAVLHTGDLTYALVGSGFQGRRRQVYETLCQFLIQGFATLGMPLVLGQVGRGYIHQPNCFGTATAADLVQADTGAKLIGSAQLWREGSLLQHGSILLRPEKTLFEKVFGEPLQVPRLASDLEPLPTDLLHERVMGALVQAAADCFGVELAIAPLTPAEIHQAQTAYPASTFLPQPSPSHLRSELCKES